MENQEFWEAWGSLAIGPAFGTGNTSIKCLSAYVLQAQDRVHLEMIKRVKEQYRDHSK